MSTDCLRNGFVPGLVLDGRFQSLSPLNHGSFGMVFLAEDLSNGNLVAIKCVAKSMNSMASPGAQLPDYLLELACHNRLGYHPNIINMVHAFEDDAHMFLVLEFCPMGDLYEAIRTGRGPLETEHVRAFMLQLIDAVEFMHSKGLYHRDIKPENILIAQDGSMKLSDFGLSTTETWSFEASVGSDRYMAPEQYDPADTGYSPALADIWGIGICLLNILFARNPFVTPCEQDVLFRDFVKDKQSLFDIFPAMSQDTFEVLEHSLAIDPSKRSLTEMRKAISRVLTFTADDDIFDEFCVDEPSAVPATANRQPLRTPSIQSPQMTTNGAFPWSQALHLTPRKTTRQLSAIPDKYDEEDLFPEQTAVPIEDVAPYASIDSLIDSALGESVKSMKLQPPKPRNNFSSSVNNNSHHGSTVSKPVSGSLPATTSKPMRALSFIFGKKNQAMSKSWSDLLDEEEEEDDFEFTSPARKDRPFEPANNWSTDSLGIELDPRDADVTPKPAPAELVMTPSATKSMPIPGASPRPRSRTPARRRKQEHNTFGGDSSSEDVSSFECQPPAPIYKLPLSNQIYSPPAKRGVMDKWAALGTKRRDYKSQSDLKKTAARQANKDKDKDLTHGGRSRSGTVNQTERPRRERKNTGGSWRLGGKEGSPKENHNSGTSNSHNGNGGNNGSGVFNFGGRVGWAFGFGDGGFGTAAGHKDNYNVNNHKTSKEIPRKQDMVRIVDWRKGVPEHGVQQQWGRRGSEVNVRSDTHLQDNDFDADVEWVGGWHDLQL